MDAEIAQIAGPQLVVPVSNARYALNAANARWGSLYDALYGTDAIPESGGAERGSGYNPARGAQGDRLRARRAGPGWRRSPAASRTREAKGYAIAARRAGGDAEGRRAPSASRGPASASASRASRPRRPRCCFVNNGLHVELRIDRDHPIGKDDPAGVADLVLESAVTTIMDCEDSVAAVDAADKVRGLPQLARPDEAAT